MKDRPRFNYSRLAMFLCGTILFLYIVLRSICISFTHDEAITVMQYGIHSWKYINHVTWTNNHLLNSWLIHICIQLFGISDFWMRLPNVIAGFLFLFFLARLLRRIFSDSWITVAAFLLIACNPFLIDFFGLARGYGLSMGLMTAGLYYFYRYLETEKIAIYGWPVFVCMSFALLANYTLLNLFLLVILFFLCYEIRYFIISKISSREKKKRALILILLSGGVFVFTNWFIHMMLSLKDNGMLDFGGKKGFWNSTVLSLVEYCCNPFSGFGNILFPLLVWSALVLFVIASGIVLFRILKSRAETDNWFSFFLFILIFGCGIAIWLEHVVMKVPYAEDRMGLYFLVLFPLFLFVTLFKTKTNKLLFRLPALLFTLIPFLSFLFSLNLTSTLIWSFNANTKHAVETIIADSKLHLKEHEITEVSVSYLQYPVYNYYVYVNRAYWLDFVSFDETDFRSGSDYFLEDEINPSKKFPRAKYKSIWTGNSQSVYRRDTLLNDRFIRPSQKSDFEKQDGHPKSKGHTGQYSESVIPEYVYSSSFADTLKDTLYAGTIIQYSAFLRAPNGRTHVSLILTVQRSGQSVVWNSVCAEWYLRNEKEWNPIHHFSVLQNDILPGDIVMVFLMNDGETKIDMDDLSVDYLAREPKKIN